MDTMKDAIIILAGGINNDGSLPELTKKRVEKGVDLYKEKIASKIILSGNYGFWLDYAKTIPPRSEAEAMKEYAESLGVSTPDIIMERSSKDTIGNAYFTKVDILEKNNWKNIVVVTSLFHLPRTKLIFDTVLGPEYLIDYVPADDRLGEEERTARSAGEQKTTELLKKTLLIMSPGDTAAVGELLFKKHPGYSVNPEISFEQLKQMLGR